jgi:drug/metabolite transporter (DMT)-like permease
MRWLALLGAVAGLAIVFAESLTLGPGAWLGIVATFTGMVMHAGTMVFIRRFDAGLAPLPAAAGSLLLTVPLFLTASLAGGSAWPRSLHWHDWLVIGYLGAIGTCAAYLLYFSLLQHIGATRTALIQVVTPMLALIIGHVFDDEPLGLRVWAGALLIVAALGVFEYRAIVIDTGALEGLILQPARALRDAGARWRERRGNGD